MRQIWSGLSLPDCTGTRRKRPSGCRFSSTPDQVPIYAGTYFPPSPRPGMPAWTQVLEALAEHLPNANHDDHV